jgi:hypothetical protein
MGFACCHGGICGKVMGWASLMWRRYIHPSEDRVLEAISTLGGHNSRHNQDLKKLPASIDAGEIIEKLAS